MNGFELTNDDVVTMDLERSFTESKTSKVEDIMDAIKDVLNTSDLEVDDWIEGIQCEVLRAEQGGGWQKGKVQISIRLEFIPDSPPQTQPVEDSTKIKFTFG